MPPTEPDDEAIKPYELPNPVVPHGKHQRQTEDEELSIARTRLTTLLGKEVREARSWPIFAILVLLGALTAWGFAIVCFSWIPFLIGLGVFAFSLVLWLTRPSPLVLHFSTEGITFAPSAYFLPYHRIQSLFAPQRKTKARFAITLLCEGGHLTLPAKLSADSEALYQFLLSQPLGQPTLPDDVDPAFRNFLRQQIVLHGEEQITIYQSPEWTQRQTIATTWKQNGWLRVALACFTTGVVWLAVYGVFQRPAWFFLIPSGSAALGLSALMLLFGLIHRWQMTPGSKWKNAMLIITPSGLALSQADLKGELRWQEIQKVTNQGMSSFSLTAGNNYNSSYQGMRGVLIKVSGAAILIADVYHWPAEHIEWLIRKHAGM